MRSLNFSIIGDTSIASALGKFSSKTDIALYDQKSADSIITLYVPSSYPEKIQPLIQVLAMADFPILSVSSFDKTLGEQIVAIDSLRFERGFIIYTQDVPLANIKDVIRGTSLERFLFVDNIDSLREEISKLAARPPTAEKTAIIIDQAFNVKGVGTVVLGAVKTGTVKVHDVLELFPAQKEINIKSIQMHDEDVQQAPTGGRVGLSIKGITVEDLGRGDVIATSGSLLVSKEFSIKFEKCRFYQGDVKSDGQYHLSVGAKINPVRIKAEGADLKVSSDKAFAFSKDERCVLLDMNAHGLRIVGSGKII